MTINQVSRYGTIQVNKDKPKRVVFQHIYSPFIILIYSMYKVYIISIVIISG